MRISHILLLSCVALASCLSCTSPLPIERYGKYMWVPGVTTIVDSEQKLAAELAKYEPGSGLGGPPVVFQWSPEGMGISAAIANGISASRGGGSFRGGRGR